MLLHKALVLCMKMLHVLLTCCAALVVGAVYADAGVRCELVLMLRMQKWRVVCCMPHCLVLCQLFCSKNVRQQNVIFLQSKFINAF